MLGIVGGDWGHWAWKLLSFSSPVWEELGCFPGTGAAVLLQVRWTPRHGFSVREPGDSKVRQKRRQESQGKRPLCCPWYPEKKKKKKTTLTIFHASHLLRYHTFGGICILWHMQSFRILLWTERKRKENEKAEEEVKAYCFLINIKRYDNELYIECCRHWLSPREVRR